MSKRFDPYHAWLGIPVEEQPPNFYRLLGIALFESQPDVIQNGLDQRLAHVKSFATGPHAAHSQLLLKEVSQAGVCLLRPEEKQIYDARLRSMLRANAETVEMRSAPPPAAVSCRAPVAAEGDRAEALLHKQAVSAGFPVIPTIVGGAIGLGLACLALFMLSSGGTSPNEVAKVGSPKPPRENLVETSEGMDGAGVPVVDLDPSHEKSDGATSVPGSQSESQPQPPASAPTPSPFQPAESQPPPTWPRPLPMAPEPESTPSPFQPADSQPPPTWPRALPGGPLSSPASPQQGTTDPFSTGTIPPTGPGFPPSHVAPGIPSTASLAGTPKSIVLDLERSAMYITLAEDAETKEVQAQLQRIANLATAYELEPAEGIIRVGNSVDVVLTQYPGVKIHLSMSMKGKNAELKVAPEIETGPGKTGDFSKRTLDQAGRSLAKDAVALNKQLAAAQAEAAQIQNWLVAPVMKTVPMRAARTKRLQALTNQAIPALQQQMGYVQARANVLQQLSLLVKQIHEKASLELVVQVEPADKAG